jgi:DNA-binding NarL/FixJ family response regulator
MPQNDTTQLSKRPRKSAFAFQGSETIKVFIVGDSHIMRSGLRKIIETEATIGVLGEINVRRANANFISRHNPDLVLVDLDTHGADALGFISTFHKTCDNLPILVLSDLADHELAQKALALGAAGIVLKMQPPAVLIAAILELCRAHRDQPLARTVSQATDDAKLPEASSMSLGKTSQDMPRMSSLTAREREIIGLIGSGLKNKDIAARLSISDITVRHHLTSIFRKLEVSDRQKLLIIAHRYGLADLTLQDESA